MLWVEAGLRDQISEIESDRAGQTENMIGLFIESPEAWEEFCSEGHGEC